MRLLLRVPRPPTEPYLLLPPERLHKARKGTDAAPRPGHKYIRRERAFVGGKLTWRYFYRDEQQRSKHAQELDPNKAHEHRLISELKKIHPELAGEPTLAKDSTIIAIKEKFGAVKAAVGSTPGWTDKIYAPSIEREDKSPENAGRSPQARVHYAVEHFPEHLKELISEKTGAYHGLKDFLLELAIEDGLRAVLFGVAGWANKDGKLRITDLATCIPEGAPKFNSRLTWTEEVVWHELGHHVHFALEDKKTEVIDAWKKLHAGTGEKISAYAHTNWMEDWAESFACSISFPKQLATECPERYDFMREHVMPEMLPRAEILKRSDEELAWWESTKKTPASLALAQARKDYPARRYFPYYSDKDQFYMVSRNGRSVMLRFGPPDKESEAGWERMPDVVDPETGLPKYEGGSFTRFNAYEFLKEIYDERGRPLDSRQAYLYLGIDDDKVNAIVTETVGKDGAPRDYSQKVYESGSNDSRHLGRKMFDALGGNLADATIEKERARVVRAKEKGKPVVMERHDWTPVEITEREFRDKSGTFKFGAIREAAEQPHVLYDIVEGKKQTRTYFDGASQSWKPVLAVRIYEQQNPDGTLTRIMVHEDSAFRVGETILAPSEDGWERYVVKENDPLEPELLALQLGTSARALLDANHRYGRGQIMDPVLSALLNPGGRRQIRCAADLQELMRAAAESDVPRRAWVAVAGGSRNTEGAAFSHIEVEWDGSGPPIVVGDYWPHKLDKPGPVRIDELLEKTGQLKLPRIVERKPAPIPVELGNYAHAIDQKTGRKVMVHIVERKAFEDETEPRFGVQALAGQGAGVDRTVRYLRRRDLVAATAADVPGQPTIVRRTVLPLEHDVLLYADNVARGSGPNDPGGLIRIMLPTDGLLSMEMLRRMPGVREPSEGELFATIAVEDIPRFRAALGGFVMDGRVRASLQAAAEDERQRFEQAAEDPLVKPEQLVAADGNLAPDGLLQNLVLGNEGIQPGPHRIKALQKLAQNNGRLIAAHFMGTGKTPFAIMAAEMMRNLTDREGKPHPNQTTKKTIFVVPLNTAENWYQEFKRFAAPPTLLGTSSLAGAQQIPKLPEHKTGESDSAFAVRAIAYWKEQCKQKPGLWNPFTDPTRNVVIGSKYFFDHEEALRLIDQFDGMVVDEAHMIARDNGISRAVERWNPSMKMWVGLTGTPIMNTLSVLPRVVRLVTAGRKDLGTEAQFSEKYLVPSAIMLEAGAKHPPRIDINPMRAGELAAILQPIMDVATTTDVKGQAMPAVLLDENEPAHMIGQQARMYRAAMARLSEEEREALALSASLGIDEKQMLSEAARARVNVARATANCPAYKAPDLREVITFEAMVPKPPKKGGGGKQDVGFTKQDVPFRLPGYDIVGGKGPQGWRGKWPSAKDVEKGRIEPGYYAALLRYGELLFGKAYEYIEGTSIEPAVLAAIKKGNYVTSSGHAWGSLANNPDYGPEGMTARGQLDVKTGDIIPLSYAVEDEHGVRHVKELKTGTRFVRDPNRKAAGLFYHQDDWDSTGRFEDTGEEGGGEDEEVDEESAEGEEEAGKGKKKKTAREQGPKPGREAMSIQRSPARREQRAMFDVAVTAGNAKCDKLEGWVKNVLSGKTGDPNPERAQFIIFGNRIGSSCRTVEAKLRTMGYQDVNEALGPPEYSSEADKKKLPSKFFVSYLGHGATLGNRNLNSEIFRRAQDAYGADLGASVFTWRTLYGSSGKALKSGEVREGWGRTERKKISECFRDEHGDPLEMPMRVRGGEQGAEYVYESSLKGGERREVKAIEVQMRSASTKERKALEARLNQILEPHYSKKPPLNARQQHVFNNCQFMVASDAANVGLNWPSAYLGMYDSLFSPMAEWQRITRAARMLPPGVPREIRGIVEKIDASIRENEGPYQQPEYNEQTAMQTVELAILGLPKEDQDLLRNIPGGRAEQIVEGYFARRALDKIAGLREEVAHKLRQEGYYPDPNAPKDAAHWISPVAVTDVDVANYIVRERLTNFERKMMRARRYLVEVQRFTTSVEVPEYTRVTVTDPLTGKKRRVRVPKVDEQGNPVVYVESPCQAEKSQLTQSRAKQKPFEVFMHVVKHAVPVETRFDFVPASANGLGITSLPSGQAPPGPGDLTDYLGEGFMLPRRAEETKKSLFYVRAPRFVAHA